MSIDFRERDGECNRMCTCICQVCVTGCVVVSAGLIVRACLRGSLICADGARLPLVVICGRVQVHRTWVIRLLARCNILLRGSACECRVVRLLMRLRSGIWTLNNQPLSCGQCPHHSAHGSAHTAALSTLLRTQTDAHTAQHCAITHTATVFDSIAYLRAFGPARNVSTKSVAHYVIQACCKSCNFP